MQSPSRARPRRPPGHRRCPAPTPPRSPSCAPGCSTMLGAHRSGHHVPVDPGPMAPHSHADGDRPQHTTAVRCPRTLTSAPPGSSCGPATGRSRLVLAAGLVTPRVVRHDGADRRGRPPRHHRHPPRRRHPPARRRGRARACGSTCTTSRARWPTTVAGSAAWSTPPCACTTARTLTWAGEPLVVADGSSVTRHLRADVSEGGRLLLRDRVALGRSGQDGGRLDCHTTLTYAGRPALVEHLEVRAGLGPGALGSARVSSTPSPRWGGGRERLAGHAAYRLHEPGSARPRAARGGAHLRPARRSGPTGTPSCRRTPGQPPI